MNKNKCGFKISKYFLPTKYGNLFLENFMTLLDNHDVWGLTIGRLL